MSEQPFWTQDGVLVPPVTAGQMREVDRTAAEGFGLGIVQIMENADRRWHPAWGLLYPGAAL